MTGVKGYSTTRDSNTELFPEGQSPGSVNNAARQVLVDVRDFFNTAEWIEYGKGDGSGSGSTDYSVTYTAADEFVMDGGDLTAAYAVGRGIKAESDSIGTLYGFISAVLYDAGTTTTSVTVAWETGGLINESGIRVWVSALSPDGRSFPMAAIEGRDIDMGDAVLTAPQLKDYGEYRQTLTSSSGAVTWNLTAGNIAYLKLTENITSIAITGWAANPMLGSGTLYLQQDSTGGWTVAGWPAAVKWLSDTVIVVTGAAWGADVVILTSLDAGASIMGNYGQGALFAAAIG